MVCVFNGRLAGSGDAVVDDWPDADSAVPFEATIPVGIPSDSADGFLPAARSAALMLIREQHEGSALDSLPQSIVDLLLRDYVKPAFTAADEIRFEAGAGLMGMYRRGRERPTFDTSITLIPIDRSSADRSGGYRKPNPANAVASMTLYADVKDIAAREAVVGDLNVATRTKSLVFPRAALTALTSAPEALAKQWKIQIGNQADRQLDITAVMDDYSPGQYIKLVAEDRS